MEHSPNDNLSDLQKSAQEAGLAILVGALIYRLPGPRIFVQQRSLSRKLFPGCWDIVGGHVENGEEMLTALSREIVEETSWKLKNIDALVYSFDWQADGKARREFDFLVQVNGDLDQPRLEEEKHSKFHWVSAAEIEMLVTKTSTGQSDTFIRDVVKAGFDELRIKHDR